MTDQHDHDGPDAALRADIRRLGTLLGQTLARQEGARCSTSSRRSAPRSAPTSRPPPSGSAGST